MKLNIGDGGVHLEGYVGYDISRGEDAAAIQHPDNSADEIRASHVLEHFDRNSVPLVLAEWVRVLKPGGELYISVPDLEKIARGYLAGEQQNFQGYLMGGQTTPYDYHRVVFDRESLTEAMSAAGLIAIRPWFETEGRDTAAHPISLNLVGTKPPERMPRIAAVLSCPRLGFNDFWGRVVDILGPMNIPVVRSTGAYWDRDLTRGIERALEQHNAEYVLTLDYDTIFTRNQIASLVDTVRRKTHIDALAPFQAARHHDRPMLTARSPTTGEQITVIRREHLLAGEIFSVESAHFGATLLRAEAIAHLEPPWFPRSFEPEDLGDEFSPSLGVDPDVMFWRRWRESGFNIYVALRVPVGHAQMVVSWPGENLQTIHQRPDEFGTQGPPEGVWR